MRTCSIGQKRINVQFCQRFIEFFSKILKGFKPLFVVEFSVGFTTKFAISKLHIFTQRIDFYKSIRFWIARFDIAKHLLKRKRKSNAIVVFCNENDGFAVFTMAVKM